MGNALAESIHKFAFPFDQPDDGYKRDEISYYIRTVGTSFLNQQIEENAKFKEFVTRLNAGFPNDEE